MVKKHRRCIKTLISFRDNEDLCALNWVRDRLSAQFTRHINSELNSSAISSLDVYKNKWGCFGLIFKIHEIFILFIKLVKHRPDVLIFCIHHPSYRIYKKLFGVKLVYYARTLHLSHAQSMSDRIFRKLRIPGVGDILNNHCADFVLTIGPTNKAFFSQYNRPSEIFEIGLPFIQDFLQKQKSEDRSVSSRVYICTQSWDSHGFRKLALDQEIFINNLLHSIENEFNIKPILGPHPRDYTTYTKSVMDLGSNFYSRIKSGDVLITGISTLALEATLVGASIIFTKLESENGVVSQEEFDRLGINQCTTESEVLTELRGFIDGVPSCTQAKFFKATHSSLSDEWARLIDRISPYLR